jgi:hypothetical protein
VYADVDQRTAHLGAGVGAFRVHRTFALLIEETTLQIGENNIRGIHARSDLRERAGRFRHSHQVDISEQSQLGFHRWISSLGSLGVALKRRVVE